CRNSSRSPACRTAPMTSFSSRRATEPWGLWSTSAAMRSHDFMPPRSIAVSRPSKPQAATGSSGVAWMLRKLTMSAPSSHHRGSKAGQYRAYMGPGIPRRLNALVGMELACDAHVLRHGCRELAGNLGADCVIATRRIAVEAIDVAQHPGSVFNAHVRRQRRNIQIIARLIALEGK